MAAQAGLCLAWLETPGHALSCRGSYYKYIVWYTLTESGQEAIIITYIERAYMIYHG